MRLATGFVDCCRFSLALDSRRSLLTALAWMASSCWSSFWWWCCSFNRCSRFSMPRVCSFQNVVFFLFFLQSCKYVVLSFCRFGLFVVSDSTFFGGVPGVLGVGLECDGVVAPRTGDVKPYNLYVEVLFVGDFFSCIERTTCTDILIALETPHRVWCHHTDLDGLVGILFGSRNL